MLLHRDLWLPFGVSHPLPWKITTKQKPQPQMLMNRVAGRQSNFQLTQDPSSHKLPALPICTLIENHRKVQLKLFDWSHSPGAGGGGGSTQAPDSSCKVIKVLINFYYRVTKESRDGWQASRHWLGKRTEGLPVSLTGLAAKTDVTKMG